MAAELNLATPLHVLLAAQQEGERVQTQVSAEAGEVEAQGVEADAGAPLEQQQPPLPSKCGEKAQ